MVKSFWYQRFYKFWYSCDEKYPSIDFLGIEFKPKVVVRSISF